jgi:hypothetical protein
MSAGDLNQAGVGLLVAMLLVLAINIGVLAVTVKLYTEILKDRKFDVREVRSGPSTPGTPGHAVFPFSEGKR